MYAPKNISRFLNKRGFVLLIRGKPGTGKSTFSLGLMKKYNMAYVATKKIIEKIDVEYPWIDKDMKKMMFAIEEKYDYQNSDTFGQMFYLLPEALRHVLNLFEAGKINGIIIDSWHAIMSELNIKTMEEKEREKIYEPNTFFLKLIKFADMGVKFVIVREGDEDDELSYLSDGLITFKSKVEDGRIYRWFKIDKLRGEEIEKHKYFFTLKNSRFRYLESGDFRHPSKINGFKKDEKRKLSTVYFDDMFPLKRGDTILFDFGEYIPKRYKSTALMGIIANFLVHNSKVILIPPTEMDMSELKYGIYMYGLEQYYGNLVYMYGEKTLENFSRKVNFSKPQDIVSSISEELASYDLEMPPLVIVGYDRLYSYLNSKDIMHTMFRIKDVVREKSGILLIAGNISDKEIKRFGSSISDVYLKFNNRDGYILSYGIQPWTRVHVLDLKYKEYPKIIKRVIV